MENKNKTDYLLPASILFSSVIVVAALLFATGSRAGTQQKAAIALSQNKTPASELEEGVLPSEGVVLPAAWGDLGTKLVNAGVIDANKFKAIYEQRGTFTDEYKNLLLGENNGKLKITAGNSGYLLNLLWALGLGNKNAILDSGEMANPAYGGAGRFASTGGWTIAQGNAMNHYSQHKFFDLTPEQQAIVDKVSSGIFRPCCGNSTHFPDCNHGMAMLGFLELMASQGVSEQDIWNAALAVNSYWFPSNYLTIATYMKSKGIDWKNVNPQEMLGADYSSSQGYGKIASQVSQIVQPQQQGGGNGCGVDAGPAAQPAQPQQQQSGCGI
ncbi:hypothetical protein D4R51_02255 [bacterium]|nr:MAG: hypothetical protein D4R51_02255 [bacterium]